MALTDGLLIDPAPYDVWTGLRPNTSLTEALLFEVDEVDIKVGELGLQRQIFISVRTDGRSGKGTANDPLNGSTPDKFDALMKSIPANSEIILLPGTFLTRGMSLFNNVGWYLKQGVKFSGCGMEVTTLKLVDALTTQGSYVAVFGTWNFGADVYYRNFTEVSEMTIDCNAAANSSDAQLAGCNLTGSHVRIHKVRVINFRGASNQESFPLMCGGPVSSLDYVQKELVDVRIEDCIVERPYATPLGAIGITIGIGELGDGSKRYAHNVLIRGCYVDGKFVNDADHNLDYIPYIVWPGYNQGYGIQGLGLGDSYHTVIENNVIRNCSNSGPYQDTWDRQDNIIRNNVFENCHACSILLNGNFDGFGDRHLWKAQRIIFENNEVRLRRIAGLNPPAYPQYAFAAGNAAGNDQIVLGELIVRGNRFGLVEDVAREGAWVDDTAKTIAWVPPFQAHTADESYGLQIIGVDKVILEDNVIRLPFCVADSFDRRASILMMNVGQVVCRNNRRPEDNSVILPVRRRGGQWGFDIASITSSGSVATVTLVTPDYLLKAGDHVVVWSQFNSRLQKTITDLRTNETSTATATTAMNHGLVVGAQISITGAVPIDYNGTQTVTGVPALNQFQYNVGAPLADATGSIVYWLYAETAGGRRITELKTNGTSTATATTEIDHGLNEGDQVYITGANPVDYNNISYNGIRTISAVTAQNKFDYFVGGPPFLPDAVGAILYWPAAGYYGNWPVLSVLSRTQFTFTVPGTPPSSTGSWQYVHFDYLSDAEHEQTKAAGLQALGW